MGENEGGAVDLCEDIGDGEGFPGAGDPEQHLCGQTLAETAHKVGDGLGLIPGGLEIRYQFKMIHSSVEA